MPKHHLSDLASSCNFLDLRNTVLVCHRILSLYQNHTSLFGSVLLPWMHCLYQHDIWHELILYRLKERIEDMWLLLKIFELQFKHLLFFFTCWIFTDVICLHYKVNEQVFAFELALYDPMLFSPYFLVLVNRLPT